MSVVGGGGDGGSSPATQLEFTQAMTDFKIMFPDMDVDVIEAVLRSNNGAVDTTIDQLLAMSADNEQAIEGSTSPPPAYPNNLPTYKEAVKLDQDTVAEMLGASSLGADKKGGSDLLASLGAFGGSEETNKGPLHRVKGWQPPMLGKLPSDFLKLHASSSSSRSGTRTRTGHAYTSSSHQETARSCSGGHGLSQGQVQEKLEENQRRMSEQLQGGGGSQQMLEDEKFALMLQNEEFMSELRGNTEFLSSLEEEQQSKPLEQGVVSKRPPHMDDALFREKLKNMGKTSRAKFARLAAKFRGGGASKLLGHAPAPSKDNLLLNAEPLVNQRDSDTEGEEEHHSTTKGRKYQLM